MMINGVQNVRCADASGSGTGKKVKYWPPTSSRQKMEKGDSGSCRWAGETWKVKAETRAIGVDNLTDIKTGLKLRGLNWQSPCKAHTSLDES